MNSKIREALDELRHAADTTDVGVGLHERLVSALAVVEGALGELARLKARRFPILQPPKGGLRSIPWAMIAPQERQAQDNHDQTLERLAERGGLGAIEAVAVLRGQSYRDVRHMSEETAASALAVMAEQFERRGAPADPVAVPLPVEPALAIKKRVLPRSVHGTDDYYCAACKTSMTRREALTHRCGDDGDSTLNATLPGERERPREILVGSKWRGKDEHPDSELGLRVVVARGDNETSTERNEARINWGPEFPLLNVWVSDPEPVPEHTCTLTQTTYDGSVPPPCAGCQAELTKGKP